MNESTPVCGWVKLYSPRGPQVTLPVAMGMPDEMLASVHAYLDAGWCVEAPGLEPGEHRDTIGWVVKGVGGDEGVPVVDLYPDHEATKYALMRVYLNNAADVAAFEYASNLRLAQMPEYVGVGRLERGKAPQTDKMFSKPPRSFTVVWKDNPKYDPAETDATKKKPKRLFVRWLDQPPQQLSGEPIVNAKIIMPTLPLPAAPAATPPPPPPAQSPAAAASPAAPSFNKAIDAIREVPSAAKLVDYVIAARKKFPAAQMDALLAIAEGRVTEAMEQARDNVEIKVWCEAACRCWPPGHTTLKTLAEFAESKIADLVAPF